MTYISKKYSHIIIINHKIYNFLGKKIFKSKSIIIYILIFTIISCSNQEIDSSNISPEPNLDLPAITSDISYSPLSESRSLSAQSFQSNSNNTSNGIWVEARSSIKVPADMASFNIKIKSKKKTVTEARENTAIYMNKVINALQEKIKNPDDIQTSSFNIYPETRWIEKKDEFGTYSESTIIGYSVENSIDVFVKNLDILGPVIDEATIAGEDQIEINSINFSVSNVSSFEKKLRENAAINAKSKADTYVESLGLELGNLVYLTEISSPVSTANYAPRMEMAIASDQYTPSSFSPGDIELSISIQANFEISR